MSTGPGVEECGGSEEQKGEQGEIAGRHVLSQSTGRSMDCLGDYLSPCSELTCSISAAPHLDFKARAHDMWPALAHLHEESHDLVAEQEAAKSMQDAALSSHCRDTMVSRPCPAHAPQHPTQSFTHAGMWESLGRSDSHISDSFTGITKGSTMSLLSIILRPLTTGIGQ